MASIPVGLFDALTEEHVCPSVERSNNKDWRAGRKGLIAMELWESFRYAAEKFRNHDETIFR
jgi:hypothetical protein